MNDEVKAIVAAGYAEHVRDVVMSIRLVEDEITELETHLGVSAISTGDRVATSPTDSTIPDGVARLIELVEKKQTRLIEYVETYNEMSDALEQIEETARKAFTYHYLHLRTWEEVCVSMHYSYRGMMDVRKRGLIQLYDVMPVEYRDVLPKSI